MRILLMALFLVGAAVEGRAGEFGCPACSQCGGTCVLQARPVTVEETCYDVKCEKICIPAVRFPWDCGPPRCGRARVVSKLTTETFERPDCEYEWVPVCERCNGLPAGPGMPPAGIPPLPPPATKPAAGTSEMTPRQEQARLAPPVQTAKLPQFAPVAGEAAADRTPINPFAPR